MSDAVDDMELSALERLEFNRRNDVAYAVIPDAVRMFSERAELDERIKTESKAAGSRWYWVTGVGGLVVHFFLAGSTWIFTWGLVIALWSLGGWFIKQHEIESLRAKRNRCNDRLYELQVIWDGATGYGTFWDLVRFAGESGLDRRDAFFCDWWSEQTTMILERVCGWEKGKKIGDTRASGQAKFQAALDELQTR